jgi:predicted ATPase
LAHEFQCTLAEACTLQAQALSYGQAVPYHAFTPLLRTLLQVSGDDAPPEPRQQIRTRLQALHPTLVENEPLLSHLLGVPLDAQAPPHLPPEAWKRQLQHVCQQLILHRAAERPLCLLIEDGHWLDSSSRELLDLLVISLVNRPILLLVTARPGFRHTWADLTYFHRLTVEPLAEAQTDVLIREYFEPHDASLALKALIRDRTGGNPFFVEELLRTLEDQEVLALQGDKHVLKASVQLDIPSSVQGVLAARSACAPSAGTLHFIDAGIGRDSGEKLEVNSE